MRTNGMIACTLFAALLVGFGLGIGSNSPNSVASDEDASHEVETSSQSNATIWLNGSLEERFAMIERHLRGMDAAMAEIGYRYGELVYAAKTRNWDHVQYQAEKIHWSMELALERRPARAESAQTFMNEDLPAVMQAVQVEDEVYLDSAMTRLHDSCVECHQAEDVLYFRDAVERIRDRAWMMD